MVRLPQVLRNVAVGRAARRSRPAPSRLGRGPTRWRPSSATRGRVLLRASGTERLVRVMVEAPTEEAALDAADRLASAVIFAFGPPPA